MKLEEQTLQESCINRLREISVNLVSEMPKALAEPIGKLIDEAVGLAVIAVEANYHLCYESSDLIESGTSEEPAIQMRSIPTVGYMYGLSTKYFEAVNS